MPENLETNVITSDINPNSMPTQCENIGKIKISKMTKKEYSDYRKMISKRYYESHKEEIKEKIKTKFWKKTCPSCHKEMAYTSQSNLNKSVQQNLLCKNCKHKLKPYEYLFNSIKYKSNQRNIEFSLTYNDFLKFTEITKCHYCQNPVEWIPHNSNNGKRGYVYNLDRMDNNTGYSKTNCCVCCKICNAVKSNIFTYSEMITLGNTIKEIRKQRIWKK